MLLMIIMTTMIIIVADGVTNLIKKREGQCCVDIVLQAFVINLCK